MIIFNNLKFLFIHIPKNSGTSMSQNIQKKYKSFLLKNVDIKTGIDKMHLYINVINKYIPKYITNNYIKFCIIRNPYEKLYSAWNFIKDRHGYENINDFIKYKLSEEFIFGLELIPGDARVHYRPQWTFIFDNKNNKKIDFIIRYENLNEDINKFNKKYNLKIPLYGNKNKYSKLNYISKFNKESITKINKLYKNDFELLDYKTI